MPLPLNILHLLVRGPCLLPSGISGITVVDDLAIKSSAFDTGNLT
jgi:hypothetical protein